MYLPSAGKTEPSAPEICNRLHYIFGVKDISTNQMKNMTWNAFGSASILIGNQGSPGCQSD